MPVSRRAVIAAATLAPLAARLGHAAEPLIRRPIPSTGEMLPAIGIGTSRRYEVEPVPDKVAPLKEAVQAFVSLGGTVIDTAPSYGTAEDVLGVILAAAGLREKMFLASKVDTTGRDADARGVRAVAQADAGGCDRPRGSPQPDRRERRISRCCGT